MADKKSPNDFWNLFDLIPAKKSSNSHVRSQITTTEIKIGAFNNTSHADDSSENKLSTVTSAKEKLVPLEKETYKNDNSLVKEVSVYNWGTKYTYGNLFCRQALYYRTIPPVECKHEHFFSYLPQFSQMTQNQLRWYIWWRDRVNNGIYLDTDCTYILLYIFELINLSDKTNAEKSLNTMIDLWKNYREMYPQLDEKLSEWVCDFSLIHRININFPDSRISKKMIWKASIPEIFYNFDFSNTELLSKFLLSYCNSYNYRKSKFYNENTKSVFEKHIPIALAVVIKSTRLDEAMFSINKKFAIRPSYIGAFCDYGAKKKIEVSYVALSVAGEFKQSISNIIKYAENLIRAHFGCRSRLGVKDISESVKKILENYFINVLKGELIRSDIPEYEKLYESKTEALSPELANKIEASSWDITEKLVEAFEEDASATEHETVTSLHIPDEKISTEVFDDEDEASSAFYNKIFDYMELFELIRLEQYRDQKKYAQDYRIILDAVADEINAVAADVFGDIILEEDNGGYKIIDEYKNLIQ